MLSYLYMLIEFIQNKLATAKYKLLDDGTYFGEIPSAKGTWANAKTLEECRSELQEVFEDWTLLQVRTGVKMPGLGWKLPSNFAQYGEYITA